MKGGCADYIEDNYDTVLEAFENVPLDTEVRWQTSERMAQQDTESVELVVTSPPYPMIEMWDEMFSNRHAGIQQALDDGDGRTAFALMHDMLDNVWAECHRVLIDGGIMAINVGDATRRLDDEFQCWPNAAEITHRCRALGFTPLINIHWKKPTNSPNAFMGSGFLPPNAYVSQDTEKILLFRKGGLRDFPPKDPLRYASQFTKEERDEWFSQTWRLNGAKDASNYAAFPSELPHRLVRMFSIFGDTVLDPFLGTGTTMHVARELGRSAVGYEIQRSELYGQIEQGLIEAKSFSREDILDWHIQHERAADFSV